VTIEFASQRPAYPGPLGERRFEPLLNKALAHPLNRPHPGMETTGYLCVGVPLVGEQEHVCPSEPAGTAMAFADHLPQPPPLPLVEFHHVLLLHVSPSRFPGSVHLAEGLLAKTVVVMY